MRLGGAIRSLLKQPRFFAVASLTLALGIGATTAIFSVVNGVLLKPLPFGEADRLVNVWSHAPKLGYDQFALSPDLYFAYERDGQAFESMALFQQRRANLTGDAAPEVVDAMVTTASYFSTLGVVMARGRGYNAAEDAPGGPLVAVISHRAWVSRFGSDPNVVGRTIRLDGEPTAIIGVAPPALDSRGSPDFYQPSRMNRENPPAGSFGWNAIARLKPGVSAADAASRLAPVVQRFMQALNSPTYRAFLTDGAYSPRVNLMKEDLVGALQRPLWILLATVGMLLVIACANVANLFLVRAEGRQREIAVRTALGADRWSLIRHVMTEALVLAFAGSAIGCAAAAMGVPALLRLAPPSIPRLDQVGLDASVIAFAVGAALLSAVLFGLVPALRYTRPQALEALKHGGRGGTGDPARRRARNALVVAQTALALILLVGSGLLLRSFSKLLATDLGFDPRDVMTFRVALPARDYQTDEKAAAFADQLVKALGGLPGVERAGAATTLPIAQNSSGTAHEFEGRPLAPGQLPPMVHYKGVDAGYFDTLRMPILRGRNYHSGDVAPGAHNIIVNQALADLYWPGQEAVGKRIRLTGGGQNSPPRPWFTVIGVVGNERQDGVRRPIRPLIYYPPNPDAPPGVPRVFDYVVRGRALDSRGDALRQAVWNIDRGLPVSAMRTLGDVVDASIVQFTFTMVTLGIAAALALLLGAVGLYGVLSYAVTLRTREIGVRLALGAPPSRVLRSVVANGVRIAGIGLAVGMAAAIGVTRFLGTLLFETEPLDPGVFASMSAALLVVAIAASYLPARRAASVSPLESMRTD